MRILSLAHTYPWPPTGGSEIRLWNMVKRLAARHEVRMLVARAPGAAGEAPPVPGLTIECLPAPRPRRGTLARAARLVSSALRGVPSSVLGTESPSLARRVRALCAEGWPEVAIAEEGPAGHELRSVPASVPRVLVKHSVHARQAEEDAAKPGRPRLARALEPWITRRFERATLARATRTVVLTPEDGDDLVRRYGPLALDLAPNGIDRAEFPPRADPGGLVVGCLANFEWEPNRREAAWLAREVWPRVRAALPEARLRLVGKGLERGGASDLAGPGIERTGFVPDVARAFQEVAVGASPVLLGSGIRNRLLALLSMGVPVVTTALGARGTNLRDGVDARVADAPEAFTGAIVDLLTSPERRLAVAEAGERVAARFTWDAAVKALEGAIESSRSR